MENKILLQNGSYVLNEHKPVTSYISLNDVSAILNINKHRTPISVFNEKKNGVRPEFDISQKIAAATKPVLIDYYEEMIGAEGYRGIVVQSDLLDFLACRIDFLSKDGGFACFSKVTTMDNRSLYSSIEFDSFMPLELKIKCGYISAISGVKHVDVVVMFSSNSRIILRYIKDYEFENNIITKVCEFWNQSIINNNHPEIKTLQDFKILYPRSNGSELQVNDDILEKIEKLKDIKAERVGIEATAREIKKFEEEYELEIKKFAGENEVLSHGEDKLAKLSTVNRKGFVVAPTTYRTLRLL